MTKRIQLTRRFVALAMAVALVSTAFGASAVSASSPPRLARAAFGFFVARDSEYMLHEADYSALSTVAFTGLNALPDGTLETYAGGVAVPDWDAWNSQWMDQVIALAHAGGARVVLTVRRFAWSATDRQMTIALLSNETARNALATAIADAVVSRAVDGVNLDFEPIPNEVKSQFVDFVRTLRSELDNRGPGLELTFDATARPGNYAISALTATGAADAVFVMAYPFHDAGSPRAGATAPLGGPAHDVGATLDRYLQLTSPDKIILGLPYYSYEWSTNTRYLNSLTRPAGPTYGDPTTRKLADAVKLADLHGWRWSNVEHVAWTRWRFAACASCPTTWRQLYFESVRSLGMKYDVVNSRNLLGVGFWKLGNDTGHPELYKLLWQKFGPDPAP
jgi:spore germination protein YaaH